MIVLSSQNKNLLEIKYKIKFLLGIKNIFKLEKKWKKDALTWTKIVQQNTNTTKTRKQSIPKPIVYLLTTRGTYIPTLQHE